MEREAGGGIGMGSTCKSMADSCKLWQKPLQYCKVISLQLKKKSRDITLLTKVCLVKAVVFLVVMYGCESWTVKKAEC